ncbi:MAG: chemotaxis protein CheW [Anaerolineae bacterium]
MSQQWSGSDWEAIWKTLDWDNDERRSDAEQQRLSQRARQYATPVGHDDEAAHEVNPLLTFDLGAERYGIDVMLVRGVRDNAKITPVPGVPSFYRGVINTRGQIVTVMDLRLFLDVSSADEYAVPGEVIIVQAGELRLGLLAHRVEGVEDVPVSSIKPLEQLPYSHGVTSDHLIVLNLVRLFEDPRLMVGASEI